MHFATLVVRNLLHRRTRSGLTIVGIAIGIGAVVALTSIARGFERTWEGIYTARGTDLVVSRAGSLSPSPPEFPQERARDLRSLPRVADASAVISELLSIEDTPIMLALGLESRTFVWDHLRLVSGRLPADDAEAAVVLGSVAADTLGKSVGSSIQIETGTFTVCGVFTSASILENGAVIMTLPQLQRLTDKPGKANFVNVKLVAGTAPEQVDAVRRSIMDRLPGFKVFTNGEVAENNTAIQAARAISWATSAIALTVGAVGVMNTVLMSVFERVQEIGVLLAVGWHRRRIVRMIVYESVALGVAGGLVGIAAGIAAVRMLQTLPLLRGKIAGDFGLSVVGTAFAVSIALGVVGGAYPAFRGSRMRPSEALRHE